MPGFGGKPAELQKSRFSCDTTRCNGSVLVPTTTRNHSSGLEPLLSLIISRQSPLGIGVFWLTSVWLSRYAASVDYLLASH